MKPFAFLDSKRRFTALCICMVVIVAGVFLRLIWLQVVQADRLKQLTKSQLTAEYIRGTPRGRIVDRDGEEMAVSIMTGSLYADPEMMQDEQDEKNKKTVQRDVRRLSADLLAPVLKTDAQKLYGIFTGGGRFVWLKRTMEPKEAAQVQKIIKDNDLKGLHFLEESKRYYTKKRAAAQILGFIGTDDKGLSGLEYQLDDVLKGSETTYSKLHDAVGKQLLGLMVNDPGHELQPKQEKLPTVYLTLDSKIQYVLEDAMDDAMEHTKAKGAAAIIMDPYTGEILGMASRPTFDPNNFGKYRSDTWTNRAVSMIYEPGSVFKPIVGCMGLTEGIITPDTLIQDNGRIKIADRVIYNWDGEGMGTVPFSTVIKFSINTGMVQLGMKLGADRLISYAKKFGFGEPTGIEIGEKTGRQATNEGGSNQAPWAAYGQADQLYTPLQLANYIATLVSGGQHCPAHLLKSVKSYDNSEIIATGDTTPLNTLNISDSTLQAVKKGMYGYTQPGGMVYSYFKDCIVSAGAKTGTAQLGGGLKNNGVFVAFAPYDDPEIAIALVLEKGDAGAALASTAVTILNSYFSRESTGSILSDNELIP